MAKQRTTEAGGRSSETFQVWKVKIRCENKIVSFLFVSLLAKIVTLKYFHNVTIFILLVIFTVAVSLKAATSLKKTQTGNKKKSESEK